VLCNDQFVVILAVNLDTVLIQYEKIRLLESLDKAKRFRTCLYLTYLHIYLLVTSFEYTKP
jgi:hypothetical protein